MQESLICSISTLKQRMGSFMHARASAFVPFRKMFKAHRTSRLQKHPYYSRYTYSSHSFGYSFSFSLKVLGVRAIVLGFWVKVRVRVRVRIRIGG